MLNIPSEKLPNEWKDEARLDSLFSPFRSRTVNPKDWDTKISSWRHLIALYCINNCVYSFSLSALNKAFLRHGRPPSCLAAVIEEMVKNGELQNLEDFLKKSPQTWGGWATNLLVKKPISWSYNTIRRSLFSFNNNQEQVYVHLEVVKEESEKLLSAVPENKIIIFNELLKLLDKDFGQAENIKLLLHHLMQQQKADLRNLDQERNDYDSLLVKFSHKLVTPISEMEISVYVMERNEKIFIKHVEDLEDEVASCIKEVKTHLLKGHRQLAKTCLKKKHEIEKRLTRKANALHNIQILLERIRDVHTDTNVWQSYKQALSIFNTTFKDTNLTEDAVEDTMVKLADVLEIHDDIQTAMSNPISNEDDGELEEELAELLKNEEKSETSLDSIDEQMAKLDISNLPVVPSQNVSLKEMSTN